MAGAIRIHGHVLDEISADARRNAREECCGLLAGRDGEITASYGATNASASASRYEIAPEELFRIMREIRAAGLALLGIYHSHPTGDNSPSPTDVERAYYPGAAYFILSPNANARNPIRAFSIREGQVSELKVEKV